MPLRVLHYLPYIDTRAGGPVRAVLDLTDALARRGHYVTIATPHDTESNRALSQTRQLVIVRPGLVQGRWLSTDARDEMRRLVRQHQIVHVHGVWDLSNVQVARLARRANRPYFVSVRGMLDDWSIQQKRGKKMMYHSLVGRRHLDEAIDIHLTAEGELDQARKWFGPGKGTVIPNLLNLDPFRNAPGPGLAREKFECLRGSRPVVLLLSRIHYKKGPDILIEAAALLKTRGVDAAFVFAGPCDAAYRAQLDALASRLRVSDRVHFIGHVDDDLKISVYQTARVMALPTSQENFGFVFPESLAAGVPVITTKGVDIWPTLERGGGSMIVDRTPEAFADAMATILADDELHAKMSRDGRAFALREFDETQIVNSYEEMYRSARNVRPIGTPRVAHFIDSTDLRGGGVPRVVLDVARTVAEAGLPSTIIAGDTQDTPPEWIKNIAPIQTPGPLDPHVPAVYKVAMDTRIASAVSTEGMRDIVTILQHSDVVHLHCLWSVANLQIADACRSMGIPYVVTTHGMLDDWSMEQARLKKRTYLQLGGQEMLEQAMFVLCTAQGEIDQSRKWFPGGNGTVLSYIIDLEPYRTLPGPELSRSQFTSVAEAHAKGEAVVLFLSRLHYKKGCELLIKAAKAALDQGKPATYVFAGTGDDAYVQSLKDLAAQLGIADRVHFVGMVKGDAKISLYEAADLFVLPTSQENFGLVLIESLACNTPVMTTRGTDIWKDIESSGSGIIVDQTESAIAAELNDLLGNREKLRGLRRGAREWVFANYEVNHLVKKYVDLYKHAASTPPPLQPASLTRTPAVLWLLGKWNEATPAENS